MSDDLDRIVESWHPQVGQRVRVRRSGECPSAHHIADGSDDGRVGTVGPVAIPVVIIGGDALPLSPVTLTIRQAPVARHDYYVTYDDPIPTGITWPQQITGQYYAAAELEAEDA